MTNKIIAHRYSKALFHLASKGKDGAVTKYATALEDIKAALDTSSMLREVIMTPIFTHEEKQAVLTRLFKKLKVDTIILNFCLLITKNNRMDCFDSIVAGYKEQLDISKGIIRGTLATAVAIDDEKQQSILAELQKKTDHSLELEFKTTPEILGGIILKVGDYVRDASLRTQLSILQDSIKRGEQACR